MNHLFKDYLNDFIVVFLDDILIHSKNPEDHLKHLKIVRDILKENKFYAKLAKCDLYQS